MIEAALTHIDPFDRDVWVMCAMAIKSEYGDGGFHTWNEWSAQSANYKERDAKAVWRSVKAGGGITIKSLYKLARDNGYRGEEADPRPVVRDFERERKEREETAHKHAQAASKAASMLEKAEMQIHPYLQSKGFGSELGFVLNGLLLIPMRDYQTNQINSVQTIDAQGKKKFLAGGRAKGSVFRIGSGYEVYLCEGYATALSVKAALRQLYAKAQVVVCFSASNMAHVSQTLGQYVIADHDESGTGEKYALKTGKPWWMPPSIGDANDFHMDVGLRDLADALNDLRRGAIGHGSVSPRYAGSDLRVSQ